MRDRALRKETNLNISIGATETECHINFMPRKSCLDAPSARVADITQLIPNQITERKFFRFLIGTLLRLSHFSPKNQSYGHNNKNNCIRRS